MLVKDSLKVKKTAHICKTNARHLFPVTMGQSAGHFRFQVDTSGYLSAPKILENAIFGVGFLTEL